MRKILGITSVIFPPDIGGPATYLSKLSEKLVDKGWRIKIFTWGDEEGFEVRREGRIVIKKMSRKKPLFLRYLLSSLHIYYFLREVDILFSNTLLLPTVLANFLLRKPLIAKIVGDEVWERVCDRYIPCLLEEFEDRKFSLGIEIKKKLRNFSARRADLIIVPSKYLKRIIEKWGVNEKKVSVLYNPIEIVSRDLNISEKDPLLIVSVGRFVKIKGFDILVKAVKEVKEARLILIGDGPEKENIEKLVIRLGLENRIKLIGKLPHDKVIEYLKRASIFVLPSYYEGLSHAVLEALYCGCYVIASRVGGNEEIIRDRINGRLFPAGDREALKRIIEEALLLRPPEYMKLSVTPKYTWRTHLRDLETLLLKLVKGKKQIC